MSTTLSGASLALEAKQVRVVLADLLAQIEPADLGENGAGLSAPQIAVPRLDDEDIPLDALGELALKEILAHARTGSAEVCLPLKPTTFRKGPFSFTLPKDARCIVELKIEEGIIIREQTKGRIEPALQLPLGVQLSGVYLDDEGSLFAALAGFPDLNLSWLALGGLKVPMTLREVIDKALGDEDTRFFRRGFSGKPNDNNVDEDISKEKQEGENAEENSSLVEYASFDGERVVVTDVELASEEQNLESEEEFEDDEKEEEVPFDILKLSVKARDVLPHLTPLLLRGAGSLVPGKNTRLDVDFTLDEIQISGEVELTGGNIVAGGFAVQGLVGQGSLGWTLKGVLAPTEMKLDFRCDHGRFDAATLRLKNGSAMEVEEVSVVNGRVQLLWDPRGIQFAVHSGDAQGKLVGGEIHFQVNQKKVVAVLSSCTAKGNLQVSNQHFSVDMEVEDGEVSVEELYVSFGVAAFDLQRLQAKGRGRLRAATDMGVAFSGLLHAEGEVLDGNVNLGPVHAHVVEGSDAQFSIRELAFGDAGIEALVAQGQLDVRLASGQIPLSESIAIQFSRGGMGRITFDELRYFPAVSPWPTLRGTGTMMARADPIDVESVLRIPAGSAHVQLGEFVLGDEGILELNNLRTWLRSDDEQSD